MLFNMLITVEVLRAISKEQWFQVNTWKMPIFISQSFLNTDSAYILPFRATSFNSERFTLVSPSLRWCSPNVWQQYSCHRIQILSPWMPVHCLCVRTASSATVVQQLFPCGCYHSASSKGALWLSLGYQVALAQEGQGVTAVPPCPIPMERERAFTITPLGSVPSRWESITTDASLQG